MNEISAASAPPYDASILPRLTLVLGGARSGKSRHAETMIAGAAREAIYLATAQAFDAEMSERIRRHRERRAEARDVVWETVEEPIHLAERLADLAELGRPVLVDCLTLWLSNLMLAGRDIAAEMDALLAALPTLAGPVVLVANEVGLGIVPENALAREFRDHAGELNQRVAAVSDRVVFLAAGLPLVMKDAQSARIVTPYPDPPPQGGRGFRNEGR